jgi:hypothetical protein
MPSKFMDKIKSSFSSLGSKLGMKSDKLEKVIKESDEFCAAQDKLVKESSEAIVALKIYAEEETPALKEAFVSVSQALETIETNRTEMAKQLRDQFVTPLRNLVIEAKKLQTEIDEDEKAKKKLESVEKDLERTKVKPKEKLKPGEIEAKEAEVKALNAKSIKEHDDVLKATAEFNEAKVKALKESLDKLHEIQKDFYKKARDSLTDSSDKVSAIDVTSEIEHISNGN